MAKPKSLTLNLPEIARSALSSSSRIRANQDVFMREEFKREFALRVIDQIVARTQDGIDKNGRSFAKYSSAYKNSLTFQLYGKSASEVNLTLTGSMLSSMGVVRTSTSEVSINFIAPSEQDKAYGHINGGGNLPKRDFFGLPQSDLNELFKRLLLEFNDG